MNPPGRSPDAGTRIALSDRASLRFNLKDHMKKGYWVVAYKSISDASATKAYAGLAVPAIESFGGRFLVRTSDKVHPHEAGLQQRTVIVEFDSYENALAAMTARFTKRRFERSAQVRNATSVSWKVCR